MRGFAPGTPIGPHLPADVMIKALLQSAFAASAVLAATFAHAQAASAPAAAPAAQVQGGNAQPQANAQAGGKQVAMCLGCHNIPGYQASFPQVHKVPMISGQSAGYIVAALQAYKKGERKHPTMRSIAGSLSDQNMADIAAFYEAQGRDGDAKVPEQVEAPPANVAALLSKGACVSCHGANFNKPIAGNYPKIAGQHADYLFVALKAYQLDANPTLGRGNAIMAAQVKQFSHAELKAIANYIGGLPGELKTVRQSPFHNAAAAQ
jgi:cytochrome c553